MKKILVIMVLFAAFTTGLTAGFKTRKMANHPEKSE